MQLEALQDLVHKSRDARRTQTLPKFPAAERDTLIKKYHPDYRENAYRPIKFGPNAGELTVRELAALLEGDSPVPADLDRKSTRLNSSHMSNSYALFCLKKKKTTQKTHFSKTNKHKTKRTKAGTQ